MAHEKILGNVVLVLLGQHCAGKLSCAILSFCSVLAWDFSCAVLAKFEQCCCGICSNWLLSKN